MNDFFIFLSSEDGKKLNPSNSASDFTVTLPNAIELENSENIRWSVALSDISISGIQSLPHTVNVMCDIIISSIIRDNYRPILRSFPSRTLTSASLFLPYYIPLNCSRIERVRIYLEDTDLSPIELSSTWDITQLSCSLHFQKSRH